MGNITVPQLTAAVRTTIGTPFHHAGRVPGPNGGLDCGGMMVVALNLLGFTVNDKRHYNRGDGIKDMVEILSANNFTQREYSGKGYGSVPGDLILIRTSEIYHHLVYLTEDETIIHAWVTTGINRIVESKMLPEWWSNVHSLWRWNELEKLA